MIYYLACTRYLNWDYNFINQYTGYMPMVLKILRLLLDMAIGNVVVSRTSSVNLGGHN
jgi:hypothetical protein